MGAIVVEKHVRFVDTIEEMAKNWERERTMHSREVARIVNTKVEVHILIVGGVLRHFADMHVVFTLLHAVVHHAATQVWLHVDVP